MRHESQSALKHVIDDRERDLFNASVGFTTKGHIQWKLLQEEIKAKQRAKIVKQSDSDSKANDRYNKFQRASSSLLASRSQNSDLKEDSLSTTINPDSKKTPHFHLHTIQATT